MGPFSFVKSIFDVGTLDTRFTTPSSVPHKTITDSRNDPLGGKDYTASVKASAKPPRWNTLEFYFYSVAVVGAILGMFWVAYWPSSASDPRFQYFEHVLSDGWIPGRKIDVTDAQYRTFRNNLLYMTLLLIFHPLLRKGWNAIFPLAPPSSVTNRTIAQGAARLDQRASFDFVFALIYISALHGFSAFKVLAILWINYQLATKLPRKQVPYATWIFNIGILFANDVFKGYSFRNMALVVSPAIPEGDLGGVEPLFVKLGSWLDSYRGLLSRWEVGFNISVLRLISFNLDLYWSQDKGHQSSIEKKQLDPANLSEKDRVSIPANEEDFSFRNYVAYALYAPLYIAGPILTFNDYISQTKFRPATIDTGRTIRYGVRFIFVLIAMEFVLHFVYVNAISLAYPDLSTYTASQICVLSYFNLHIIWLKLLLPWRMFRLWSLVDGIDPPENMVRCVSNNFSPRLFWRAWHRSYNRWLIRYIFIPLGGARFTSWKGAARSLVTFSLVFTFVALWHDIKMRLLIWGWLIVLFLIPEMIAQFLFKEKNWEGRETQYRMLCSVGAVGNALMMIMANTVGFAIGVEGLDNMIRSIFGSLSGFTFLIIACSALFTATQIMFEMREEEKRRGIDLRC